MRRAKGARVAQELIFTAGDFAGAAVWTPPGEWRFTLARRGARRARRGGGVRRAPGRCACCKLLGGVERVHLREPHYYLFAIGADPAHQGRGVGAALLAPMLARCDAEKLPAYLESSNPANLTFYRRHGFVADGRAALRRARSSSRRCAAIRAEPQLRSAPTATMTQPTMAMTKPTAPMRNQRMTPPR